MGNSKKVSIVLPTHNGDRYIRESIDSCLNQTYGNIELIVIDDASADNTPEILKTYLDPRLKVITKNINVGLATALNIGFSETTGEYLTWTSDDNYYTPEAIEVMVNVLESDQRVDFVYASCYMIDEKNKMLSINTVSSAENLLKGNCIGACFLYRRKIYEEIGEFSCKFSLVEDYEYWLRVYKRFQMRNLNKLLYFYRMHGDTLSAKHRLSEIEGQAERARIKYFHIKPSLRYFHSAKRYFSYKDTCDAKKSIIKSLMFNPFNINAWRYLVFLFLKPSLVKKIGSIKRALLGQK